MRLLRLTPVLLVCTAALSATAAASGSPARELATATTFTATTSPVVWAVGDLCAASSTAGCAQVADLIASDANRDAFLALGDLQYEDGALTAFNSFYKPKVDSKLAAVTRPAPGNHEYHTSGASAYYSYFGSRAGAAGKGYYSYALGGWRLVAANSNCGAVGGCSTTSTQGKFITSSLNTTGTCEIVYDHHPAFSDGSHGDTAEGKQLFGAAYNGRAELFISGHDHEYQRFPAKTPSGSNSASGVVQLVVGTGGKDKTSFRTTQRSAYRQNTAFGAVRLVLGSTGYTGAYYNTSGAIMDRFSGTCH